MTLIHLVCILMQVRTGGYIYGAGVQIEVILTKLYPPSLNVIELFCPKQKPSVCVGLINVEVERCCTPFLLAK